MSRIAVILLGSAALLTACNMAPGPAPVPSGVTTSPGTTPTPAAPPTPQFLPISGDWQFSTTSTTGMSAMQVGGGLVESGGSVTGAILVNGPTCFGHLAPISLVGTLTGNQLSLTSTASDGQVIALTGQSWVTLPAPSTISPVHTRSPADVAVATKELSPESTYISIRPWTAHSRPANSKHLLCPAVCIKWPSTRTVAPDLRESRHLLFGTPCFSSGTVTAGTLSSGSFLIGTEVDVQFQTPNGTITFTGTVDLNSYDLEFDSYSIYGNYHVSGGTCDGTGTAALRVYNPWDY